MTSITRIDVQIITGNRPDAGADGGVYLGIGGREFRLKTEAKDFQMNADQTFILGENANISNATNNDPRSPAPLRLELLKSFPIYIRFAPKTDEDIWNLEFVYVTVNPGQPGNWRVYHALPDTENLWLGASSGLYSYLWPVPM